MINRAHKMDHVHSDISGPLYVESQKMIKEGIDVLRLNTGNPATFGFTLPDSIREAMLAGLDNAVAYCDPKGMPEARQAIYEYRLGKGLVGISPDDIYIGNGVSELVTMALNVFLNDGDELRKTLSDFVSLSTPRFRFASAKLQRLF